MDQECDGEREHDEDFDSTEHCGDACGELDAAVGECPDESGCGEGDQPPRDGDVEFGFQCFGYEIAEKACESSVAGDFVDEIAPCGQEAGAAAEAACGERVVASAGGHVAGKLRDGVADEEAHDGGEQERDRHHRAGFGGDDGEGEDDVAGGGDGGDGLEDEFGGACGVKIDRRNDRREEGKRRCDRREIPPLRMPTRSQAANAKKKRRHSPVGMTVLLFSRNYFAEAISSTMDWAAARGPGAAGMGWPTTRKL